MVLLEVIDGVEARVPSLGLEGKKREADQCGI